MFHPGPTRVNDGVMSSPQQPSQDSPFPQASSPERPYAPTADAPPPFPNTPTPPTSHAVYTGTVGVPFDGAYRSASAENKTWAIFAHLSAAIASVVSVGWLSFLGPLIIYLIKKDSSPLVRNASAGAFNFALSMTLTSIAGFLLTLTVVGAVVGVPLMVAGALLPIILGIVGAVKASNGVAYTYPFQLKVLS